ncbi:hypothetical protein CPB86DRAFT_868522 [Serendipita vermifera]|nr:hypothetical protein CPB86DRAFT_868522 [Serendipita vermifera]
MVEINEDIVYEILQHLWALHYSGWDEEFRPEAFRRFFLNYALISRVWTLPSEKYIYRSTRLKWASQWHSFRSGLTNPRRGEALRNCVRILELSLSNRRLGIPVKYLHVILRSCPRLVELRLRIGAEVNTLYPTILQEKRLRSTFSATFNSLRALQVFVDQRSTKSRVIKEVQALIAGAELDFVTLATDDDRAVLPTIDPLKYEVEVNTYSRFTWPVETNSYSISMSNIHPSLSTEPSNPVIKPETIRFHSDNTHNGAFFDLFAPHIKQLLYRVWSHSSVWGNELHTLLTKCPQLERLIVYEQSYEHIGPNGDPILHIMEPQDWHKPVKSTTEDESEQEDSNSTSEEILTGETTMVEIDDFIKSASHIVSFNNQPPKWWTEKDRYKERYRRDLVCDPRPIAEAFYGQEEEDLYTDFPNVHGRSDYQESFLVAMRRTPN